MIRKGHFADSNQPANGFYTKSVFMQSSFITEKTYCIKECSGSVT